MLLDLYAIDLQGADEGLLRVQARQPEAGDQHAVEVVHEPGVLGVVDAEAFRVPEADDPLTGSLPTFISFSAHSSLKAPFL